jgi:hypothetical protein
MRTGLVGLRRRVVGCSPTSKRAPDQGHAMPRGWSARAPCLVTRIGGSRRSNGPSDARSYSCPAPTRVIWDRRQSGQNKVVETRTQRTSGGRRRTEGGGEAESREPPATVNSTAARHRLLTMTTARRQRRRPRRRERLSDRPIAGGAHSAQTMPEVHCTRRQLQQQQQQ